MRDSVFALSASLAGAAVGLVGAAILHFVPGTGGLVAMAGLVCWLAFLGLPWLVVPVGVLGAAVLGVQAPGSDLPTALAFHVAVLGVGGLALLTRRALGSGTEHRLHTSADLPMLLAAVAVAAGAGYGLVLGTAPSDVLDGAAGLAIVPAYFFLATCTLTNRRQLTAAALVLCGGAVGLLAVGIVTPVRHDGTVAAVALVAVLALAGQTTGWRTGGCLLVAGVLGADVALSGGPVLWLASGAALVVLVVRGTRSARRAVAAAVAAGAVLVLGGVALASVPGDGWAENGWAENGWAEIGAAWDGGAALVPGGADAVPALRAFADNPFLGTGLGQLAAGSTGVLPAPDVGTGSAAPRVGFWVAVVAQLGVLGLLALAWPLCVAVRAGLRTGHRGQLGFAALLGCLTLAGVFATGGGLHWELGLLPAATLLTLALAGDQVPSEVRTTAGAFRWGRGAFGTHPVGDRA